MTKSLLNFLIAEDGAVTVDWVVLTAAIVGLGLAVLMPIAYSTTNMSSSVGGGIGAINTGLPTTP